MRDYRQRCKGMEQLKTTALIIVIAVIVLCSIYLFICEHRKTDVKKIMLITVMTALAVAGRIAFAALPGFKPVTAVIIITGMYLGSDAGFYCGALTALITNFYFGQGAFTPFQMLIWGCIGIIASLLSKYLKKDKFVQVAYGIFAGIIFSVSMDIYTVIWTFGSFRWSAYGLAIASAVPFTVIYAVSNVVFLLVLSEPIGKKIEHAMQKYSS